MILFTYLLKRYLSSFLAINSMLTLLFVCVEFFEKLLHAPQASAGTILQFLALSCIPTWFDYLPVSSWLATLFVLLELRKQNEWESLAILGVRATRLLRIFACIGLLLMTISLLGSQMIALPFKKRANTFKAACIKKEPTSRLYDAWFLIDTHRTAYVGMLDRTTNSAHDMLLVHHTASGTTQQLLSAEHATLDAAHKALVFPIAHRFTPREHQTETLIDHIELLPTLFDQLSIAQAEPSLLKLTLLLARSSHEGNPIFYHSLLHDWLSGLLWHLQVLLYPLITLLFFFLLMQVGIMQWIALLSIYPITISLISFTQHCVGHGSSALLLTLPYTLLIGLLALWRWC